MADSSKTEEATPKRRDKARESGQVARSRELPGVLALAGVAWATTLIASTSVTHWTTFYRNTLYAASTGNMDVNGPLLFWSTVEVMRWIAPILLAGMMCSAFSGMAQGGVNFAPKALAWKFDRFNPVSKLGQIFSPVGLSNLLKSLLPFGAILWLAISALRENWETMVHASSLGLRVFAGFVGSIVYALTLKAGLVLLVWAAFDYTLTVMKMSSDMKMTKQEVRDEYKESDGNPVIKSRIRSLQRAMRRRQSLKAAAKATVVVTNPTHYAIALRYEPEMPAPIVVAKGRDLLAEKIKQLARDMDIMLVENKSLAQALYQSVEVGDSIPAKLYQAVAEILALVFRAEAEVRRAEAARVSRNASGQKTESASGAAIPNTGATR
jgi:flagellar biosynthetic protein FlhB